MEEDAAAARSTVAGREDQAGSDAKDDTGQEEGEEDDGDSSGIPVDRGWAWIVVVGCFGMHVLVVGGVKSFGVLFVELQQLYDVSAKQLGVVHGLASVLMMALGPVSNALSVRYTCRAVVFAGGLLIGTGFIASAFVPSFPWLYFTYSTLTGLGASLAYAPSVVMVGHHFTKRRALANGISVSGSAVGSFLLPNLMRYLLNQYGLRGALFIIGAIMLHVCLVAVLFRPFSTYSRRRRKFQQHHPSRRKQRMKINASGGGGKELALNSGKQAGEVGGGGVGGACQEKEEGEEPAIAERPAPFDGGSLSTPLTPSLGGGAFHEDIDDDDNDDNDNVFEDKTREGDDVDPNATAVAGGGEGCFLLNGTGEVLKERHRSSSNSCCPKTSQSSSRSVDPIEDETATTADLEEMEEDEVLASVIHMNDGPVIVPRDDIPPSLNKDGAATGLSELPGRTVVTTGVRSGSSPKDESRMTDRQGDVKGGIFNRPASTHDGIFYDPAVGDVMGVVVDNDPRCEGRDKGQRALSQPSGHPLKPKNENDSVLQEVAKINKMDVQLTRIPDSNQADSIHRIYGTSENREQDDTRSKRANRLSTREEALTSQGVRRNTDVTKRSHSDSSTGRLQDLKKRSPNLERVIRGTLPSAPPPSKEAPPSTADTDRCPQKSSPAFPQHRPFTRSDRNVPASSTTSSSTDTDSGVDVITCSSIRSSLEKKLLRNSSQGSMTTHFGSFKQRCQDPEREGSFKLNFRKDSSKSKSSAGGGSTTPLSGSVKRRAFKKGHPILERHPSALWDARLPESLKQAIEEEKRRTQQQQQQQQAGDSIELSNFSASSALSLDCKEKSGPGMYRASGSLKDSSKSQHHQRHGSAGRGRIGSFKAIDIANPIRLINERKKLLLASNVRYMSETGDVGVPALAAGKEKAPLKRYYSVEATRHQQRSPTSLNESFLHRRIRKISEMDSAWPSESSVFASAGDLALASLQNISESANEAEDDTFSTTSRGSRLKGIFRLSAETVRKGEKTKRSVPLFDFSLMANPVFLVFFLSLVCMNFGYPNIFVMLPSFCQEVGLDKTTAAFMVSIIGLTDLVGRIFIGWLSDLRLFPRKYGFMVSLAGAGALCTSLPSMKSYSGLVAFSCGFGFCGGCFIALIAVILVDFLGKERLASSFGLASVAMAVGIMAGPAIYGDMRDTAGSWDVAFVVSGFMSLAAASCIFMEPCAQYLINRQLKQTERQICDEML